MAYIIRTQDPFHPCVFVCSNCYNDLFAFRYNDVSNLQSVELQELNINHTPLKQIPCICDKCLEPLELENGVLDFNAFEEEKISVRDMADIKRNREGD